MTDRISFAGSTEVEGRRIRGSVVLKGSRTLRGGEYVEVDPGALIRADASDVFARVDHDPAAVLGRTRNGTLTVQRTEDGISYETGELPNTQAANDALELARKGYFGGSSFAIEGLRSKFDIAEDGTRIRRITTIARLVDVAPVYDPAFSNSTAAAFSKETDDVTDIIDEAPDKEATPAKREQAQFNKGGETADSPKVQAGDPSLFDRTLGFAKTLTDEQLKSAVQGAWAEAGDEPDALSMQRIEGFTKEAEDRRIAAATADERRRELKFRRDITLGIAPKAPEQDELFASRDYEEAFKTYLRTGRAAIMEQFAQTIAGDGTQGGFTVPDGFVAKLTERLKAYGGISSVAQEITTTTGESLRWPYIDDTSNKAVIASEDTQAASGADLVFDSVELGAFEYDATGASGNPIEVSLPLLQDSAFDIEGLLTRLLSTRIGRKQADDFATGSGVNQPTGLFSKSADTMTATVASLAAPEHIFQVDRAYRDNARWVMSDTSLAKLWAAQATTNEPLFQPGRTLNGKPFDVLFGYPIVIDNSAGNLVAFGDIEAGYIIRRVRGVQLLVDPYTAQKRRAVQYHAWARADGNIQDANAYSVSTWASVTADT